MGNFEVNTLTEQEIIVTIENFTSSTVSQTELLSLADGLSNNMSDYQIVSQIIEYKPDVVSSENTNISIASIDNLQSILDGKQSLIQDNTLAISTIDNLQSSLDAKEDVVTSTTNISSNTLNTVSDVSVGGNLSIGGIDLDTKVATATSGKQDTLTAGDNITIDANNVISSTATGGGTGTSAYFLCSLNIDYTSLLVGNYARFPNIVFQNPSATTIISTNSGHGYTIQEDGLYHIGFSITALDINGTVEIGIVYVRNGVETIISRSGIAISLTEDRSIIWPL